MLAACCITTLLTCSLTAELKVQDQQMLLAERPSDGSMLTLSMRKSVNMRTHASLSYSSVVSCTIKQLFQL